MTELAGLVHRTEQVNGIDLHWVEAGKGPLVLLVHGFPESWYSWRYQLPVLADAGYRAVAIDVRGYGGSGRPHAIEEYRMLRHVADNLALVDVLGEQDAVVVGHDWGAPIAWASAHLRPDVFWAVAGLSVPFTPSGATRPTDAFAAMGGDEEFYISYFQEPGRAETEIEADVRSWLRGIYVTLSGEGVRAAKAANLGPSMLIAPGGRMRNRFVEPEDQPAWLTEDDLDFYVGEFERSGFTGPLNRYRNVDRDWEDLSVLRGRPIEVPALFIGGELDGPTRWGGRAIERFPRTLPRLTRAEILPGCGHWVQQERPDEVNALLLEFLDTVGA
ncbi:alpha/beta hydrolase [Aeromicrobium phragmitis]|uniref:Alpha/beta hydrolase n=1 Tax=Aeromicrobium phragmitis TaxID=2478914 RepID=A0A3L8PKV5_9ACTN|nr:alpha/beta hydrolase [Aeromicrobium phragmitis]RLV55987.1 alpha/beta hydrolase [Aeromicrobium phragmitis]